MEEEECANCSLCNTLNCTVWPNATTWGNDSLGSEDNQFVMPWWQELVWGVLFGGMVIVATGGNLIVIWIVLAHRRMRTVTNYFLVNLSVTDTMMSTLNTCFNFVYMLSMHWPFGHIQCKLTMFVSMFSVAASVFTLVAISIDRYSAIMYPLRPRMSRTATVIIILGVWLSSGALCAPYWIYADTTIYYEFGTEVWVRCYLIWPDGVMGNSYIEYIYNVVLIVVTYCLPISAMTFTYARIGAELWGSRSIGETTAIQLGSVKSKRKVVKMMIVVVIIFAVCWLPYHVYFLLIYHYPDISSTAYIQHVYLAIYWLAMSNSMYNPMIYCWMNARFRRGFKLVFRWCPFVKLTDADLTERRNYHTTRSTSCAGSPDHVTRIDRNGTVIVPLNSIERNKNGSLRPSPRNYNGTFSKCKKLGNTT